MIGTFGPCDCRGCGRTGTFSAPDFDAILNEVRGRKGLRTKRPDSARAYYVWRMARFHGGADVTIPMFAMSEISGDPFVAELDSFADLVAKAAFGTNLAAAHRWGGLLGLRSAAERPMKGLPATAYELGPVLNGVEKPECELLELR